MSYGWLTESALLPARAVPITGISETSLHSLSRQIFTLQQERAQEDHAVSRSLMPYKKRNLHYCKRGISSNSQRAVPSTSALERHRPPGSVTQRHLGLSTVKANPHEERLFRSRNARVEERAAADKQYYFETQKTLKASRKRLEEKARFYDNIEVRADEKVTEETPSFLLYSKKDEEAWYEDDATLVRKQRLNFLRSRLQSLRSVAHSAMATEAANRVYI